MARKTLIMNNADHQRLMELLEKMLHEHYDHYLDLHRKLQSAHCMDAADIPADVVTIGSTVCLRELDSGDLWTFTLCYPPDMDIDKNRISVLSPLGTAIFGQRVGDIVDWPVPAGSVRIQIEELVDQPESREIRDPSDLVSR